MIFNKYELHNFVHYPGTLYGRCKREGIELSRSNPTPWSEDAMAEALEAVRYETMLIILVVISCVAAVMGRVALSEIMRFLTRRISRVKGSGNYWSSL